MLPLTVLIAFMWALTGAAQADDKFQNDLFGYEFQERQYISFVPNDIVQNDVSNPLLLEAQVGPMLPIFLIEPKSWRDNPVGSKTNQIRLLYNFRTYVRMTRGRSQPVVTPSYMSTFKLQWLQRSFQTRKNDPQKPVGEFRYGATFTPWTHHSNGQDGCTFLGAGANADTCPGRAEAVALNEKNGSFSTNYIALAGHFRYSWGITENETDANFYKYRRFSIIDTFEIQRHHNKVFPGGLDPLIRELWGTWHMNNSLEFRFRFGQLTEPPSVKMNDSELEKRKKIKARPKHDLGYIYGKFGLDLMLNGGKDPLIDTIHPRKDRHTFEAGWIFNSRYLNRVGIFARIVTGRDYYNIQFSQDVTRFQAGITFDTTGRILRPEKTSQSNQKGPVPPDTPNGTNNIREPAPAPPDTAMDERPAPAMNNEEPPPAARDIAAIDSETMGPPAPGELSTTAVGGASVPPPND